MTTHDDEKRPGPEPERLKLPHEDWEEAVREALEREKPEEGSSNGAEEGTDPAQDEDGVSIR